jgi:hypothetical protein
VAPARRPPPYFDQLKEHTMRMISFKDGGRMDWNDYRRMMNGEISPRAAVARMRREPAGAYDAAMPRRQARDQNGRLDGAYVRATNEFLKKAGVASADLDAIAAILDQYVEVEEAPAEDEENLSLTKPLRDPATGRELPEGKQVRTGGPRGPVGSAEDHRRYALDELDQFGRPRRNLVTAMPLGGDDRGWAKRWPDANNIKVV